MAEATAAAQDGRPVAVTAVAATTLCLRDVRGTLATLAAGFAAGAVSRTATAPLDRIKVIAQEGHLVQKYDGAVPGALKAFKTASVRDVARIIHLDGGVGGFWRGNGVNVLKAGPEFAMVFGARRWLVEMSNARKRYEQHGGAVSVRWSSVPPLAEQFAIGAVAGAMAQLVLYPLEVVKTRIATARSGEFRGGMREVAREAWHNGGIRDFYVGLTPNLVGIFLYRGAEMSVYFTLRAEVQARHRRRQQAAAPNDSRAPHQHQHHHHLSVAETATIGMAASLVAQTVTYPLNVVRTRLQTQGRRGRPVRYSGMLDCFRQLLLTKGPHALFAGLTANYLKAVPASGITFVVFERVRNLLLPDADD